MDKSGIPGGSDWFLKPGLRNLSICLLPMRTLTVSGSANRCLQTEEGWPSGATTHNVLLTLPSLMEKIQSLNIITLSSSYKSNTKKLRGKSQRIRTALQLGRCMYLGVFCLGECLFLSFVMGKRCVWLLLCGFFQRNLSNGTGCYNDSFGVADSIRFGDLFVILERLIVYLEITAT